MESSADPAQASDDIAQQEADDAVAPPVAVLHFQLGGKGVDQADSQQRHAEDAQAQDQCDQLRIVQEVIVACRIDEPANRKQQQDDAAHGSHGVQIQRQPVQTVGVDLAGGCLAGGRAQVYQRHGKDQQTDENAGNELLAIVVQYGQQGEVRAQNGAGIHGDDDFVFRGLVVIQVIDDIIVVAVFVPEAVGMGAAENDILPRYIGQGLIPGGFPGGGIFSRDSKAIVHQRGFRGHIRGCGGLGFGGGFRYAVLDRHCSHGFIVLVSAVDGVFIGDDGKVGRYRCFIGIFIGTLIAGFVDQLTVFVNFGIIVC